MDKYKTESGFALLMTLIVVGAVLSVGLSMLDLTLKQVRLSTNAKESEIAFHAANAGLECAQYWRRTNTVEMEVGDPINPVCFGGIVASAPPSTAPSVINSTSIYDVPGTGSANLYNYQFSWGLACTRVRTMVVKSDVIGGGVTINSMNSISLFPAYPEDDKICPPGAICTVISVQGYNKPCTVFNELEGTLESYGVVQREVLLEL